MAYNYNQPQSPPMQNQGWGGQQPTPPISPYSNTQPHYPIGAGVAPTPVIDAAALTPQLQPAYQAPQFTPLPPPPPKPPGGVMGVLKILSSRPPYQAPINTGESSLSMHGSPPVTNPVFTPQQYGAVAVQPSPMTPVVYNQGYTSPQPVAPMPGFNPLTPVGQPGQPGQAPVYQQRQQQQQQHYQQPGQQQPQQPQQPPHQQPHQQQPHQQQQQPHQQQPQLSQQPHQQQQQQQPQPQPQQPSHYPQLQPHQQQPHQQQPQPQPHQQHQQPQPLHPQNQEAYSDPAAPPPAYTQGPGGGQKWPEKPTIQSNYAAAPAALSAPPTNHQPSVPQQTGPLASDDTKYWASLVSEGIIPLAPKTQLRGLFRGIAACILRECVVDSTPSCVLSPARLSMYYGQYSGYGSRSARLFARAQTAPHTLATLYMHLAVEHVLIPSDQRDGRRKPEMPALTIRGFEHWLLLTALLDPDREHARLAAFIAIPGRRIQDDNGVVFPAGSFPRGALPPAPDAFVCRRYGGFVEEAMTNENPIEKDSGWRDEVEDLKKRLFEREEALEKRDAEVKALQKEVAKLTAAADAAVTKMSGPLGIVLPEQRPQHNQSPPGQGPPQNPFRPEQRPQQSQFPPDQRPQQNPFSPYPQQQQHQYQPQSPQPPLSPRQQYQQPPQLPRRQSEQTYAHENNQPQPHRRQTEQFAQQQPQQPTYSRPTYQPQR